MKNLSILFLLVNITICNIYAKEKRFEGSDSLSSFLQVKDRSIIYLLGLPGNGPFRHCAIEENDKWIELILAEGFEPLIWEDSLSLTMNDKIKAYSSELRKMAIAFRTSGSRYEQNPDLKQYILTGIENVLKYFNPSTTRPGNWHPWLISIPNNLGSTALIMEPFLSEEELSQIRITLRNELGSRMVLTGTNAVWEARNHIYLALLDNDTERLKKAADYIFRTVRYGTDDGVREDFSYLFHGRIPYAGGYGTGFAQTIAEFIYVFEGTCYSVSPKHLEIIINLLLEHTCWFLADEQIDLHVRGRSFKERGSWDLVLQTLLVLAQIDNPRKNELAATAVALLNATQEMKLSLTSASFADKIQTTDGTLPQGFRYWSNSEIGVFNNAAFHVGFRQFSNRVQDYEYLNRTDGGKGEGGANLPYGFTNILRKDGRGSWYSKEGNQAMLPEIDLEHLPGTTSRIGGNPKNPLFRFDPKIPTMSTSGYSLNFGKSPFAGGAGWKDGGVAGFILEPAYGEFTAKKSLHFFPDGFWALGSDIRSVAKSADMEARPLHTTVLQWVSNSSKPELIMAEASVQVSKDSVLGLKKTSWFWLKDENIAVIFHEPTNISVRLKGNVITVWIDHSLQALNARYAYAVLPNSSLEETKIFAAELPFRPVRYDSNVHAVKEVSGEAEGIVFYNPDSCMGIKSQSPLIVFRKSNEGGGIYTLQDPLHQLETVKLTINNLQGEIYLTDNEVNALQSADGSTSIDISSVLGRLYRFGYGAYGLKAYSEPRENLDISSYNDFHIETKSDKEKTILTVHLPDEAVKNGYHLSVHFNKSQRLHDFTEADVIDRPTPNTVRYRWNRNTVKGPSVFSNYWKVTDGKFLVYLVTQLTEQKTSFTVPKFD